MLLSVREEGKRVWLMLFSGQFSMHSEAFQHCQTCTVQPPSPIQYLQWLVNSEVVIGWNTMIIAIIFLCDFHCIIIK